MSQRSERSKLRTVSRSDMNDFQQQPKLAKIGRKGREKKLRAREKNRAREKIEGAKGANKARRREIFFQRRE